MTFLLTPILHVITRYLTPPPVSPVPLLPSPFVDSFIQPGYDTMLEQIRDFSSDDDDDDDDVSSDSEIDDLPIVDFTVHEDIKRVHLHV